MSKHKKEIDALRARVHELEAENVQLKEEIAALEKRLDERKIIERAKGVLMARCLWNESTAWRNLQRCSMNTRVPLVELARRVLNGDALDLK